MFGYISMEYFKFSPEIFQKIFHGSILLMKKISWKLFGAVKKSHRRAARNVQSEMPWVHKYDDSGGVNQNSTIFMRTSIIGADGLTEIPAGAGVLLRVRLATFLEIFQFPLSFL